MVKLRHTSDLFFSMNVLVLFFDTAHGLQSKGCVNISRSVHKEYLKFPGKFQN